MTWRERFYEMFRRNARQYQNPFIDAGRVDVEYDASTIEGGDSYCRLWLVEMHLTHDRDWFRTFYPVVHALTRFDFGGEQIEIPSLAGPSHLRELSEHNLNRVIQCNYPLTPLFPFNQGLIEIEVGLFAMLTSDPIARFVRVLGDFSKLLPVSELTPMLAVAEHIRHGIDELLTMNDENGQLHLGYHQTFSPSGGGGSNDLRPGYFAAILAEENELDPRKLCIVDDHLRLSMSPNGARPTAEHTQPLSDHSYMLFRLERRDTQDWESLTKIKELVNRAQEAVLGGREDEARTLLSAIKVEIFRSRELTKRDRRDMGLKIEAELKEFGLSAAETETPKRSLQSIMKRTDVAPSTAAMHTLATLANPYFHRSSIKDTAYFFGRQAAERQILNYITNGQSVALIGPRRIGKSSLLLHLAAQQTKATYGLDHTYKFVYFDCQSLPGNTHHQTVYKVLLEEILDEVYSDPTHAPPRLPETVDFRLFNEVIEEITGRGIKIVLMLDEFEAITANAQLGQIFFQHLRALSQEDNVVYITSSAVPLHAIYQDRGNPISAFFNVFSSHWLGLMTPAESDAMLQGLATLADFSGFSSSERRFLHQLAGTHPFFLQLASYFLFENKIENAHAPDYALVSRQFNKEAYPHFLYAWEHLSPAERAALHAVVNPSAPAPTPEQIELLEHHCLLRGGRPFGEALAEFVLDQPENV